MAKVAVITGSGSGLGRALAVCFANKGIRVLVCDVDFDKAQQTCALCESNSAFPYRCDVTRSEELKLVFQEASQRFNLPVSIFVNNAGIALPPGKEFESDEAWKKMIHINLTSVLEATKLASSHMISEQVNGVILNIASAAGIWPQALTPVYAAAKAGVIHFTRSLRHLQDTDGIRVLCLAPTFFETPLLSGFREVVAAAHQIMSIDEVVGAAVKLLDDSSVRGGSTLVVEPGRQFFWPSKSPSKL